MQDDVDSIQLDEMISEHRKLDHEVHTLADQRVLSSREKMRLKALKVRKLRLKDAIRQMQS